MDIWNTRTAKESKGNGKSDQF